MPIHVSQQDVTGGPGRDVSADRLPTPRSPGISLDASRLLLAAMLGCCFAVGCSPSPKDGGSSEDREAALRYLPDNSFLVLHTNVASILDSDSGRDVMDAIAGLPELGNFEAQMDDGLKSQFGVGLRDLTSVSLGGRVSDRNAVVVLRFRDGVDVDTVLDGVVMRSWEYEFEDAEAEKGKADESSQPSPPRRWVKSQDVATGTYYAGQGYRSDEAIWFPDDRTLVHGPANVVKEIDSRYGTARLSNNLTRRVNAVNFSRAGVLSAEIPQDAWQEMEEEVRRNAPWLNLGALRDFQAGSVELFVDNDVRVVAKLEFASGETAADAATVLAAAFAALKQLFELPDDALAALDSVETSVSGTMMTAELTVSRQTLVNSIRTISESVQESFDR